MSNYIDSIQLSGTVYTIQGSGGGGNATVEVTQAEYDALVSAGTVSANTYYIITDAQALDISQYWTSAQTQSAINAATSGKVNTSSVVSSVTSASTDSEIPTAKAVYDAIPTGGTGGGKAISAGTNISVTTGETADTINCTLPISATSQGIYTSSSPFRSSAPKQGNVIFGSTNFLEVFGSVYRGDYNTIFGNDNQISPSGSGSYNFIGGNHNTIFNKPVSYATIFGYYNYANNVYETSLGRYNNSVNVSTTFGDSGNTLFSVGNGTANNARHNAFEIRQNGDIYLSLNGQDVKLQDHLGGGGGSITIDPSLDSGSTNPVANSAITTAINAKADTTAVTQAISEATSGKADTSAVTAVQDSLSGYVTTNTDQNITGVKTFVNTEKGIIFKQKQNANKIGFSCQSSASTANEIATFEFRPNTYTDSSNVKHPLLYLGHYRSTNVANNGIVQTMVGFRQYDQSGSAAYHYLIPLPAEAKTPFSLTTSFKNYFAPLGFKNGDTMITTDNTGVADFSSVLGGLKLVKITAADYANITPDENTVYFVGDSTNGYTMKLGSANVN